ncbi:hypothetical protein OQA88_7752 [Cercophora sp. LCS_1]
MPDQSSSGATTPTPNKASPPPEDVNTLALRARAQVSKLLDEISLTYADLPLLACCAISGLCDSVAFNATGTFASMQTGNTIFLALGASSLPPSMPGLWLRALVSITAFQLGCFIFSHLRHLNPLRRSTLTLSFLLQSLFIIASAILAQTTAVPAFAKSHLSPTLTHEQEVLREHEESQGITLLPLALLAFQFGGQIVASRVLGYNEVPTNVLTSLYCDLLSDPGLFVGLGKNPKRNRRVAAIVLLVLGGIIGGWLQRGSGGMSAALWMAGGIKLVIAVGWIVWPGKGMPATVEATVEKAKAKGVVV